MNPNRQNNCFTPVGPGFAGRQGGRPPMPRPANVIGNTPCCSDVATQSGCNVAPVVPCCSDVAAQSGCNAAPAVPCCSDVISGGIIIGSGNQECNKENVLNGLPIAMAYVPWQSYCNLYSQQQALRNGTLFRELDLDFAGRRCN